MPDIVNSPAIAMRAGNRTEMMVARTSDPVYRAKVRWNDELVLNGEKPTGSEPPRDGVPYSVPGAPQPFCWPNVKVSSRAGFLPGPEVRFQQKDDGMHLTVVFEEDPARRIPNTVPFDVKVNAVKLIYGTDPADVLDFPQPLPEPLDPAKGPAFTIEADALVPTDERRARIVSALQTAGGARWVVTMAFQWLQTITPAAPPPTPPGGVHIVPGLFTMHVDGLAAAHTVAAAHTAAVGQPSATAIATKKLAILDRPDRLRDILIWRGPPQPQPTTELKTITFDRGLRAEYPNTTPENRPIYAAVTGDYTQVGWKNTAHGWFQPTPIQDTVYTLPHAYRLQVDETTGLPAIQAVLLRKSAAGAMTDSLDPKFYTVRLTLKVRPDFDAEQLNALRTLIRAQSASTILFADLVLGGYSGARFVPDPSLAGLGELFAGASAEARDAINPEEGFTLTYEGNAEFIDLLFQRLKANGIEGTVELDLQEPGGTIRKQPVPVVLTLRQLAAVPLPWTLAAPAAAEPAAADPSAPAAPDAAASVADNLPREITLRNPTGVKVTLGNVQAHALQKSPVTGHVDAWYAAGPDGAWPRTLEPGASAKVQLAIQDEKPLYNAWDVALIDCHAATTADLVLGSIFDAATAGVRGWQVAIDCPPLAFFDQLTPDDQAKIRDVVALEVEVRRKGSQATEEVRLTRPAASGVVLLSRTVADFVTDRSVGRSTFEYRQRAVRLTRADAWTDWREETGSAVSVFLA